MVRKSKRLAQLEVHGHEEKKLYMRCAKILSFKTRKLIADNKLKYKGEVILKALYNY
jgi:hypothetical protein